MFAEGRVENQKLNQTAALLSFGRVFGFQLDLLEKNLVSLAGFTFTLSFIQILIKIPEMIPTLGFKNYSNK